MSVTAAQLIDDAATKIGVKGRGRSIAPDEQMKALRVLKQMVDGWALENLMIPHRTEETFALGTQRTYTWGLGGSPDWNSVRPIQVEDVRLVDAGGQTYRIRRAPSLNDMMNQHRISRESRPGQWWYEEGQPHAEFMFSSTPFDPQVRIWSIKPLELWLVEDLDIAGNPSFSGEKLPTSALSPTTLQASFELEMGYEQLIVYNLAVELMTDYPASAKLPTISAVIQKAENLKTQAKRKNFRPDRADRDPALVRHGSLFNHRGSDDYDVVAGPG